MVKKLFISGGCSFTLGNELSDDVDGKTPSRKSWAYRLYEQTKYIGADVDFVSTATGGSGNSGIARRVFNAIKQGQNDIKHPIEAVVVMWSFKSRYDWAMPRNKNLEETRWATISPWDATIGDKQRHNLLAGSEVQQYQWKRRQKIMQEVGVSPFAEAIYKHAANDYHETYLSWKSIIWLQDVLEKHKIPFLFTLADNSLFYAELEHLRNQDSLLEGLCSEIDFTKWFSFGERNMGFNQWATLNEYEKGTTHPLDDAHEDAVKLMLPQFIKLTGKNFHLK
jgi:hypothetical protein|tara:strand:- start:177 stop:1016 length:840 start_codon:yes stop_codon:yes gene_type:complete